MLRSRIAAVARYAVLGLIACGSAAATYAVAGNKPNHVPHPAAKAAKPVSKNAPDAQQFAIAFVQTTEDYAKAHGESTRIVRPHCVEASTGHYMCAYTVVKPHRPPECHLMQAMWTPDSASTITVTLAGRAHRCGSVREAVRSLD